jgi:hypothetical protein
MVALCLIPAQRILIGQKFKERLIQEAKENQIKAGKIFGENHPKDKSFSPKGETLLKTKVHTEKELAKLIGVGSGTLARFDQVMKSENEIIDNQN